MSLIVSENAVAARGNCQRILRIEGKEIKGKEIESKLSSPCEFSQNNQLIRQTTLRSTERNLVQINIAEHLFARNFLEW